MNIDERKRTCSYCQITYRTHGKFAAHWKQCPVRIKHGYIKAEAEDGRGVDERGAD